MIIVSPLLRARAQRLVGFAAGGVLLWLVARALAPAPAPTELVVQVSARASAVEIERAIDEAVLVETALSLGLPWSDPFVRARVVEELRAADPRAAATEDDALLERARRLGLVRAHPVLRARIAAAMERRLATSLPLPDDAALREYLREHADRYAEPTRVDLEQVLVGAPSMLPRELVGATAAHLEATFGTQLASAASATATGAWSGPVRSPYGVHWLHVRARELGGVPELATVRDRVARDWAHDRSRIERASQLSALREAHAITVVRAEELR